MADRRLPFSVHDDAGEARQGEILILRSWQSDVKPNPAAAFTIVLSEQPLPEGETPQLSANVALCAPVRGVRLPAAVSEAAAVYGETAPAEPAPIRLSRSAHQAFADGTIFAPPAISITSREMFTGERPTPRLETLALQLIRSSGADDGHWRAMDEALSLPREPSRTATPEIIRTRLRALLNRTAAGAGGAPAAAAIERLAQIADGAAPAAVTAASGTLADDIAFLRCLEEQPAAAAELSRMRLYLDGAHPASRNGELAGDRALARELISFVTVLAQPHRLEGIRASFEMFRAAYAVAYVAHHEAYVNDAASLRTDLEEASPGAAALRRLNTLRGLGGPLGRAELAAYDRLSETSELCRAEDLEASLRGQPVCPSCGISMEGRVPTVEAEQTLRRLQVALARQQDRLAGEAVRRILARGGERLQRFVEIVQAADVAAMTRVLDDDLLTFLDELLSQPLSPTADALAVFEELVRAHPSVGGDDVDGVAETLRRLLTEQLEAQRTADPTGTATFRLATEPLARP